MEVDHHSVRVGQPPDDGGHSPWSSAPSADDLCETPLRRHIRPSRVRACVARAR